MSSKDSRRLTPLTTNWHNRSRTSIDSDAATYHSARAHQHPTPIELETQFPRPDSSHSHHYSNSLPQDPRTFKMDRKDSGYSDGNTYIPAHMRTSSRRPSSATLHRRCSGSLNSSRKSSTHTTSKRPPKSSRASTSSKTRCNPSSRHQRPQTQPQSQYQYFHFPSLSDDIPSEPTHPTPATSPPPATVHYWTSDSTRRLEYAAIDAASKGIRGFVTRCIPDCFLPVERRRRRFCKEDMEDGDDTDAGSVRRYRLVMVDEAENEEKGERTREEPMRGHRRRWSSMR